MFEKPAGYAEFVIAQFVEITRSNEALARSVLRDVNFDLEAALTIYFSGKEAEANSSTVAEVAKLAAEVGTSLTLRDDESSPPPWPKSEKLIEFDDDDFNLQSAADTSLAHSDPSTTLNRRKVYDPTGEEIPSSGGRYEDFESAMRKLTEAQASSQPSISPKPMGVKISWPADLRRYNQPESPDDRMYGIVVRQEQDYAVIWSVENQLICAAGYGRGENVLGGWVTFKSFNDYTLTVEAGQFRRSAYDVANVPPRRISHVGGTIVKCQALVRLIPRSANEVFQMARDEVFGVVLCSFDSYLTKQLRAAEDDEGVEVMIVWMENYQRPTNWIAIAVNHGDNDWRKLEKLPDHIDKIAKNAFAELRRVDETSLTRNILRDTPAGQLYRPPPNWRGFVQVSERQINDVLGVVICHEAENSVSVVYTIFGLARFPSFLEMGTWLQMSIMQDAVDGDQFSNASVLSRSHYQVRQSVFIAPPMSTRVITADGADRLLICGTVTYMGPRCFENVYMGKVFDKKQRIMMTYDANTASYSRGFLVEFSVFKKNSNWYCNILKCHGNADGADHVELEGSVFPDYLGRVHKEPVGRTVKLSNYAPTHRF